MNVVLQALSWCSVQVTVLATVALGMDAMVGRRRPAARAIVAISALVAVVGLSATALCPLPAWGINWDSVIESLHPSQATAEVSAPNETSRLTRVDVPDPLVRNELSQKQLTVADRHASRSLTGSWAKIAGNWAFFAAALYLVGIVAMTLRIGLGLNAVRGYRRDSRPLTDRRLSELANGLRGELGCHREIELRENSSLGTAATIGWRRPIILLPRDWPNWTDVERRAVIAHEIEHVRRRDFPSWIIAQIGVALHFYHPLVHFLAARLRLQQELAADAAAARALGGQRLYVTTLAAMALRQSDALVAWPARAFLPSSKTFVRRIEMLHRSQSLRGDVSRPFLVVSLAAVSIAALCAAGFRSSAAAEKPGGDASNAAVGNTEEPTLQPKAVQDPGTKNFKNLNNLRNLALAIINDYEPKHGHVPPAVIQGPGGVPHSWRVELLPFLGQKALYDQYRMDEPWDSPANQKVLERMPEIFHSPYDDPKSTNSAYFALVGPGTVFEGADGITWKQLYDADGTTETILFIEAKRNIPWTKPEDIPFDPQKPLPAVGGFEEGRLSAAFADGHAARMKTEKIKDQLKWLIMRNDGHAIQWRGVFGDPPSKKK
ncbi:MAG TPA: M56 family metallopeptidase [Planctomycetaceae bacterium]|jgi:beta-lactamase regulating signal transducer with metallopeptidase domain|nr:M56 family metallopeptidase [Planctomycetaceae bacterium]